MDRRSISGLKRVVEGIDETATTQDCLRRLDQRGRGCTPKQLIDKAKEIYDKTQTIEAFLAEFGGVFEFLHVEGDAVTVVYPRCFCHHIADEPKEEIPDEYCECSRSWVRELFESAIGQDVEVEVLESVIRGGEMCRFSVSFPRSVYHRT